MPAAAATAVRSSTSGSVSEKPNTFSSPCPAGASVTDSVPGPELLKMKPTLDPPVPPDGGSLMNVLPPEVVRLKFAAV